MFLNSTGGKLRERLVIGVQRDGDIPERYHGLGERIREMVERTSTAVGQSTTELEMIYENRAFEFRDVVFVRQ